MKSILCWHCRRGDMTPYPAKNTHEDLLKCLRCGHVASRPVTTLKDYMEQASTPDAGANP